MARAVVAVVIVATMVAPGAGATTRPVPVPVPVPTTPATKALVVFDASTGQVLQAFNDRENLRVASTFKLLTALVVRAHVPIQSSVPVKIRATAVPPLRLGLQAGSTWNADDLLHSMLIASLNDTAIALAEQAGGGSLMGFDRAIAAESRRLGLADHPMLHDPAGLDDDTSFKGGNLISARDLAIVARAVLADPLLAAIVKLPKYSFIGGDGKPHVVYNHNAFLHIYPDAIGMKTGYTELSGHSLVAAARRNGRTLVAVIIGSADPVGVATSALDAGFVAPLAAKGTTDVLPASNVAGAELGAGQIGTPPPTVFAAVLPIRSASPSLLLPGVIGLAVAMMVLTVASSLLCRDRRHEPTPEPDRVGASR